MKTSIRASVLLGKVFRENLWFFSIFFLVVMSIFVFQTKGTIIILFSMFYKILFFLFFFSSKNFFLGKKINYFEKFLALFFITFSVLFLFFLIIFSLYVITFKLSWEKSWIFWILIVSISLIGLVWFFRFLKYWCLFVPVIKNWEKISEVKFLSHEVLKRWCFENLRLSLFNWRPVEDSYSESEEISFWNIDELEINFFRFFDTRPVNVDKSFKIKNFNLFKIHSKFRGEVKK